MKTKTLLRTSLIVIAILSCYGLLSFHKGNTPQKPGSGYGFFKGKKVQIRVWTKEINKAISKSTGKKILLNIYPVKLSSDMSKNDITLKVFFQDAGAPYESLGPVYKSGELKKQLAWYIQYLKKKKMIAKDIPSGYFKVIDKEFTDGTSAFLFYLTVENGIISYCSSSDPSAASAEGPDAKDDDKKEPDCKCEDNKLECTVERAFLDSTGKCPPECPSAYMLYTGQVESAKKITFADNKLQKK